MKMIKLMADYHCHPLWHASPEQLGDIDPEDLPLSSELKHELKAWARAYDATLCMDAPQNSSFGDAEKETEFKVQGHRLAERLRHELGPDFRVLEHV